MGRKIAAALAGIALLLGVSVALILWLTRSIPGAAPSSPAPFEHEVRDGARPDPQAVAAGIDLSPASADLVAVAEPEPDDPLPPSVSFPPELDVRAGAPALEAVITKRCGRMRLEVLHEPGQVSESQSPAVLLLSLKTLAGEARIVDSSVQAPGKTRPALVACARWALRGQIVAAPGVVPGRRIEVPVMIGLVAGR